MRIGSLLLAATLSLAPGVARAGSDDVGTTAANFLTIGAGAGILGMGGAGLGIAGGLSHASWNAASLGWLQETQFVISHAGLQDSRMQEWAAVGGRFGEGATRWSVSGLYQSEGAVEGRDAANNPTGDFNVSSIALGTQVAHAFSDRLAVGLGARFVSENLSTVTGSGFTFDGGVQARHGAFGFGLAGQNIGGQMRYAGVPYRFPGNIGAGVSYAPEGLGLRFAVDANFPMSYYTDVRTGVEWMWRDRVALRMGYRHELGAGEGEQLSGPAFGLGAGVAGMWMDYGYVIEDGGGQHRIGLTLSPKSFGMHADGFGMNGSTPALDTAPPVRDKQVEPVAPKPAKAQPAQEPAPAPRTAAPAKTEEPKPAPPKQEPAAVKPVAESKPVAAKVTPAPAAESKTIAPVVEAPKSTPVVDASTTAPAAPGAPAAASEPAPAKIQPAPAKVGAAPAKSEPAPAKIQPRWRRRRPSSPLRRWRRPPRSPGRSRRRRSLARPRRTRSPSRSRSPRSGPCATGTRSTTSPSAATRAWPRS
jgi:hypothetical protein